MCSSSTSDVHSLIGRSRLMASSRRTSIGTSSRSDSVTCIASSSMRSVPLRASTASCRSSAISLGATTTINPLSLTSCCGACDALKTACSTLLAGEPPACSGAMLSFGLAFKMRGALNCAYLNGPIDWALSACSTACEKARNDSSASMTPASLHAATGGLLVTAGSRAGMDSGSPGTGVRSTRSAPHVVRASSLSRFKSTSVSPSSSRMAVGTSARAAPGGGGWCGAARARMAGCSRARSARWSSLRISAVDSFRSARCRSTRSMSCQKRSGAGPGTAVSTYVSMSAKASGFSANKLNASGCVCADKSMARTLEKFSSSADAKAAHVS